MSFLIEKDILIASRTSRSTWTE